MSRPHRVLATSPDSSAITSPRQKEGPDPWARVVDLGGHSHRVGFGIGLAGALVVHGAAAAHGYTSLLDLNAFARSIASAVIEDLRSTYAVEVEKKPPPPPAELPPPEPEPRRPLPRQAPSAARPTPEAEKPPAPAEAGKLLTAAPDPDAPLDLTDQGFVTGSGERFAGGVTAASGTSKTAVTDTRARPGGVVGGTGNGPVNGPVAAAPSVDRSRPAKPATLNWDDCGFPPEADVEQINLMRVKVVVTVDIDGRARSVSVLDDPGYGFGNLARRCALRKSFLPGLDAQGRPVVKTTQPISIKFVR